MKYECKLWLNKYQYIAVLENVLVIVTVDENKEPIRYAIFGGKQNEGK